MKYLSVITFAILLSSGTKVYSQEVDTTWQVNTTNYQDFNKPLFILNLGAKKFEFRESVNGNNELSMNSIKTEWIESINVHKGDKAISQYGVKGSNGVIEIQLKESSASLMSSELIKKFQ